MVDGVVAIVGGGGGKRGGIPGRSIPEGTDPASDTSVEEWLKTHAGSISANAAAYAGKIVGKGYSDLYSIAFTKDELVAAGLPAGHAATVFQNAQFVSRLLGDFVGGSLVDAYRCFKCHIRFVSPPCIVLTDLTTLI